MIEIFLQQRRKYHQKYDKVSSRSCISLYTFLSLSQELKVILLWFIQKLLRNVIFVLKNEGFRTKVYLFLDGIEFTCKIIFRTKQYKERKKRYGMDHITKMLSRTMTSESYPNLRGSLWNLWIKVALPLSYKTYIFCLELFFSKQGIEYISLIQYL